MTAASSQGVELFSDFDPEAMLGVALPCLTIGGVGYFRLGRAEDLLEILGLLE